MSPRKKDEEREPPSAPIQPRDQPPGESRPTLPPKEEVSDEPGTNSTGVRIQGPSQDGDDDRDSGEL